MENSIKLYHSQEGIFAENDKQFYRIPGGWDDLVNQDDPYTCIKQMLRSLKPEKFQEIPSLLPPIGGQEVWASGVTYYKSREARMDESKDAGGGDFYDRVYYADRPELFMKALPHRVVGHGQKVKIRGDSQWNVPEPELTLMINPTGKIVGYTIGNDMSSRDIEGENPLYLPQAKCYDQSAALGPCMLVTNEAISENTNIRIDISRLGKLVFTGETVVNQIKRRFDELIKYLYLELSFPNGCLLMTGTGIVPPNEFTLDHGDEIRITIDRIGTLINYVA